MESRPLSARTRLVRALGRRSLPRWTRWWLRDSGIVLASEGGALLATTALAVLVARALGPASYGTFAGFFGLSAALARLIDMGAVTWLLRELAAVAASEPAGKPGEAAGKLMTPGLAVMGALLAALLIGTVAVSAVTSMKVRLSVALVGLMAYTGLVTCAGGLETIFRAHRRLGVVFTINVGEKLALLAAVGVALGLDFGMAGIAIAYVVAGTARLACDLWRIRAYRLAVRAPLRISEMRRFAHAALPLGIGSSAPSAAVRLDVFAIGLLSAASAGFYAVAERFVAVLTVIPVSASTALYPVLARHHNRQRATVQVTLLLAVLGGLLALVAITITGPLVRVLFGPRYDTAVPATRIMLLSAPLMFASTSLMAGLFSQGLERAVLLITLPTTLLGTAFVIAGQSIAGTEGACVGFDLRYAAMVIGLVALALFGERRRKERRPEHSLPEPVPRYVR